ncbi:HAD domain-containing protein [Desulfobacterales bacterium HSG2]|nr:HAD domain-containing protein [Desulfobacterales bacterium HSG2]
MKKVIFLDIDGVLQPLSSQKRFDHDMDKLQERLSAESDEGYQELNKYDIAAVRYDWEPNAVKNMKSLCERTQAEFVISSDWRSSKTLDMLRLLFKIQGLDGYVADKTEELSGYMRDVEIEEFLISHPDIGVFVIIDDSYRDYFERRFPGQFVYCDRIFDDESYQKALSVLQQDPPSEETVPEAVRMLRDISDNSSSVTKAEFSLENISVIRRYEKCSTEDLIGRVSEAVEKNSHISHLTLSGLEHNMSFYKREEQGAVIEQVWEALRHNNSVRHLDVSYNYLKDISVLIKCLKERNCFLETLSLRKNMLTDESMDMLAEYVSGIRHPFSLMLQGSCDFLKDAFVKIISENSNITAFAYDNQYKLFVFGRRKSVPENLKLESRYGW